MGQQNADGAEGSELLAVERVVGLIGTCEVAHDQVGGDRGEHFVLLGENAGLGRRQAEPIHAGVDVDCRPRRAALLLESGPFLDLGPGAENRPEVGSRIGLGLALDQPVEDIDRGVADRGTKALALLGKGDEECVAAGLGERQRRGLEADPVAIALDHRGRRHAFDAPRQHPPIVGEGGEIDGQPPTGGRLRRSRLQRALHSRKIADSRPTLPSRFLPER